MSPIDEEPESTEQAIGQDEHHQDAVRKAARNGPPFGGILERSAAHRAALSPESWIDVHHLTCNT